MASDRLKYETNISEGEPVEEPRPIEIINKFNQILKERHSEEAPVSESRPIHSDDISDLEKRIHDKIKQQNPEPVDKQPETPVPVARPRKADLIDTIVKLQECWPIEERHTIGYYRGRTIPELEKLLSVKMNSTISDIQNKPARDMVQDAAKRAGADPNAPDIVKMSGTALFQVCSVFCKAAELATVNFQDSLGTSLAGLTEDVNDQRDIIEQCLAEIYAENSAVMNQYLTPQNRLFLTLGTIAINRAAINSVNMRQKKSHLPYSVSIRPVS